jgi:hypothetical protein
VIKNTANATTANAIGSSGRDVKGHLPGVEW